MIRYNEIVDRTEPYNNPSDISYHLARVAPTTLAPPSERVTMTVLQTLEEQVKEYGTYQRTIDASCFKFVDYEMDNDTTATIAYRDDDTLESVRFW